MEKNIEKKVLLIIAEGKSDRTTLYEPLRNYFSNAKINIKIEITKGDFAYNDKVNEENCIKHLEQKINDYKEKNFLEDSDFLSVVHIIDTDGAFMNIENIHEDSTIDKNMFEDDALYTKDRQRTIDRFGKKKKIYIKLGELQEISNIKYYKFYFSRNLEHALYDIPNATTEEKINFSNTFEAEYKDDSEKFEQIFKDILFNVPNEYIDSWDYIFKDNNSTKRGSNMSLMLEIIKNDLL